MEFGFQVFVTVIILLFICRPLWSLWRDRREHLKSEADKDRAEAMFKTMFPELQPHFHPERVDEYVNARLSRAPFTGTITWNRPPGFPEAAAATLEPTPKGERTVVVDAAGKPLVEFLFERRPEGGGFIRVGKGKLTATRDGRGRPKVRYWHPDREFEWRRPKNWTFKSRMAEEPISSNDSGSTFSSSPSSSSAAPAAAAAAGLVGLGGSFDGGGSSGGWDDRGGSSAESGSSESAFSGASASGDISASSDSSSSTSSDTSY